MSPAQPARRGPARTPRTPRARGGGGAGESAAARVRENRRLKAKKIAAARRDPVLFCQYVLKDEQTNKPIRLVDMHAEWHDLLSKHRRCVLWTFTDAGKTSLISIGRVLWEIGNNPEIRILLLCAAEGLGQKIISVIKRYIETSLELAEVFPNLRRGPTWTAKQITVKRKSKAKDYTIEAFGADSKSTLGARVDLIVVDDYLNAINTATEHQRKKSYGHLKSTIEGRKGPNCRFWFIGNAWHLRDAMHLYGKEPATFSRKFPVIDPATGKSRWAQRWPDERIQQERADRGTVEAGRSLDCQAADENTQWFPIRDVWRALIAGDGLDTIFALRNIPKGSHTITAIDLGVRPSDVADPTAIVSIICDEKGRRRILAVEAGKWRGSEIITKALEHHRRYGSILWVETNGAQDFLRQELAKTPLWDPKNPGKKYVAPVQSFETGKNRVDPRFGIQSLAAEMGSGAWIIPNRGAGSVDVTSENLAVLEMNKEVLELIGEALAWSPEAHTGDRLQALWIAREGSRKLGTVESGHKPRNT